MTSTRKSLRREMNAASTDRTMARVSPANVEFVRRIIRQKRNEGWREPTVENWARAMLRLDEQLGGRAFASATPDDMGAILDRLRRVWGRPSLRQFSIHVKAAYRIIFDAETLPKAWSDALRVRQEKWTQMRKHEIAKRLVSDEDFEALLRAASTDEGINRLGVPDRVTGVALLWTQRDSAFRPDEGLSLDTTDVRFRGANEVDLALRPEAPELGQGEHKTGPRTVPGSRCTGALKALLSLHPFADAEGGPLFLKFRSDPGDDREGQRLRYESMLRWLRRMAKKAGIKRSIIPYDLRHTRLTEISHVMRPAEQNDFAGWSPKSNMWSVYNHVKYDDLVRTVQQDAGITPLGFVATEAPDSAAMLAAAFKAFLLEQEKKAKQGRT